MFRKVTLLATGLLVAVASEAATNLQLDQQSCQSLVQALDKSGWTISRTDQGDIILSRETDQPENASTVPEIQDTVIDFATLPERLKKAGWIVEKDDDGSLKIHWPELSETAAPASVSENASMDALRQTLQKSGWDVDKTSDGDLLLYPDSVKTSSVVEPEGNNPSGAKSVRGASGMQHTKGLDTLQKKLESEGWITSRDKNGDLKIYWSEIESTDKNQSLAEYPGLDLEQLIPLLKNTGWQVERSENGDLLLYPTSPVSGPSSETEVAHEIPPADADSDGVPDEADLCPGTAHGEQVNTTGCAEDSLVLEGITFRSGSSVLMPEAKTLLNAQAARMSRHPELRFKITGHTDSAGTTRKNQALSENRAKAVFQYLISKGIGEKSMIYSGAGESSPIASNSSASGRKKNRRVELRIIPSVFE